MTFPDPQVEVLSPNVFVVNSERAESTGATGDKLKEGAAINQSLSSLGNVIAGMESLKILCIFQ